MRISIRRPNTGLAFFPGLAAPRELDLAMLPSDRAEQLARLAEALVAAPTAPPPTHPDAMRAIVTVAWDDGRTVEVAGGDSPALAALLLAFETAWRSLKR